MKILKKIPKFVDFFDDFSWLDKALKSYFDWKTIENIILHLFFFIIRSLHQRQLFLCCCKFFFTNVQWETCCLLSDSVRAITFRSRMLLTLFVHLALKNYSKDHNSRFKKIFLHIQKKIVLIPIACSNHQRFRSQKIPITKNNSEYSPTTHFPRFRLITRFFDYLASLRLLSKNSN